MQVLLKETRCLFHLILQMTNHSTATIIDKKCREDNRVNLMAFSFICIYHCNPSVHLGLNNPLCQTCLWFVDGENRKSKHHQSYSYRENETRYNCVYDKPISNMGEMKWYPFIILFLSNDHLFINYISISYPSLIDLCDQSVNRTATTDLLLYIYI